MVSFPLRVNEPAGRTDGRATPAAVLWLCPTRQTVPPVTRPSRCRAAAGSPETLRTPEDGSDRSGSNAAPVAALGSAWWHGVRFSRRYSSDAVACALLWRPKRWGQRLRQVAHRHPPTAPPSPGEGDLWGDLSAVGQVTGSLLGLRRIPPSPTPSPGKGPCPPPARPWAGARESEQEDQL